MTAVVAADFTRAVKRPSIQHKFFAINKAAYTGAICRSWLPWIYGTHLIIYYVQCLLDAQRTGFAVGAQAVPVEKPESRVAGLLDFGDQQSGA